MRTIFRTATLGAATLALLTGCTSAAPAPTAASAPTTASTTASATSTAETTTANPTPTTDSPSPTTLSPSPSATTTSATPTTAPPPAQTVQDVAWVSARLPVMCGGSVEMVQLRRGGGKTKDGLIVEFLDVTFGSLTTDPVDNIAVIELDCIGAHPGPVDAPVFRSGSKGPEFLGFATMSLDRFGSAAVSSKGVFIHGIGYSDTAPGCCPDLATTVVSAVDRGVLALQERDVVPLKGAPKNGTQCDVLTQIDAQLGELAKQVPAHPTAAARVTLAALTPAVAAASAERFLNVLRSQLQRACP